MASGGAVRIYTERVDKRTGQVTREIPVTLSPLTLAMNQLYTGGQSKGPRFGEIPGAPLSATALNARTETIRDGNLSSSVSALRSAATSDEPVRGHPGALDVPATSRTSPERSPAHQA